VQLDPSLALDSVNQLCLKDYMCTINPLHHLAKIFKDSAHLLVTYQESVAARNLKEKP